MKSIFFTIVILFISCNEGSTSKSKLSNTNFNDTLKMKLIGKWGDTKNAMWDIRWDSIYYFERSESFPYKILNNDLIIYPPESKGILRNIRVIKDTLFFLDEEGSTIKGYRFKESWK